MFASHLLDRAAYLMYDAKLYGSIGEYALNGITKALKTVHTAYHDILHATVLQVCKHFMEKSFAFDPRGRVALTPSGEIVLTLLGEIKMVHPINA